MRSVGARDIDIGLGFGVAAEPTPASLWLRAGILADMVDAAAALMIRDRVPPKNFMTGFLGALGYAVIGTTIAIRGQHVTDR